MSWQDKTKNWCHKTTNRIIGWAAPLLMAFSSMEEAKTSETLHDFTPAKPKTEKFSEHENSFSSQNISIFDRDVYLDMSELDMSKAGRLISQMTFGEVLQKGIISKEDFQNYQYSSEDIIQMKSGSLGKLLEDGFNAKKLGRPKGDCLTGVRQMVAARWGYNIWTHSGMAREWPEQVVKSEMPVVVIGQVKVDSKTLEDKGNIKREDLKLLQNALVVIDGNEKGQPAGHVSLVCAKFDKSGQRIGTVSYCDGKEDYDKVVDQKIGGGKRRYGDNATVMIPSDVKIPDGLADYALKLVMQRHDNALEVCLLLGVEKTEAHKVLNSGQTVLWADINTGGFSTSDVKQKLQEVYAKLADKEQDNIPFQGEGLQVAANFHSGAETSVKQFVQAAAGKVGRQNS